MSTAEHGPGLRRARELAALFAAYPEVVAVAMSGSQSSGAADAESDIDLCVYTTAGLPSSATAAVIERSGGATRIELDMPYWGGANLWVDVTTGMMVDAMFLSTGWIEQQIARVMEAHEASLGYSTSFCRTVAQSRVLYDPRGWLGALQARSRQQYPEALRRSIIAHNHPVLRTIMTSYLAQIEYAVRRADIVSVNHRVAALLASYFDIVFALNRVLHPGEKRLLAFAQRECAQLPAAMHEDIGAVLSAAGAASDEVLVQLGRLLDRLDELLAAAGCDPRTW